MFALTNITILALIWLGPQFIYLRWRGVFRVPHGIPISFGTVLVFNGILLSAARLVVRDGPFLGAAVVGIIFSLLGALFVSRAWRKHIPPRAEIFTDAAPAGKSPSSPAPGTCKGCGATNPPAARFCRMCGEET